MITLGYPNSYKSHVIRLITFILYRRELKRLSNNFALLSELVRYAHKKYALDKKDEFLEAYLILTTKFLLDVVACKSLWERGLYGSAHAMATVVLRTYRMAGALLIDPSLLPDYLAEEKTSDRDDKFRKKFSEAQMQKRLDQRFGKIERGPYANHDKTLHGSSVGTKIYYAKIRHNPDGSKGGDLICDAFLEDEKATSIVNTLSGAALDMSGIFLEKYMGDEYVDSKEESYKRLLNTEIKELTKWGIKDAILQSRQK